MSEHLIIFSALICFALMLFVIGLLIFKKGRGSQRNAFNHEQEYINDQIYVGNLAYRVDENDLQSYFARYGAVQTIRIVKNFRTGRSKGYAFITYANPTEAVSALVAHGKDLYGRSMVVRIAKPRQQQLYSVE